MCSLGSEVAKKAMWLYPKVLGFNPPERWGHSACYSQGFIYVFGGCCGGLHFSDIIVLNLERMTWNTLLTTGKGPGPRDSHSAVLFGHRMIIFGGTNGSKKVNDLHILNLGSREWARLNCKGVPPSPRESHSATLVGDDKLVIFGGSGEGEANYLNDLHVLDLKTMKWTSPEVKGNAPVPRDSHSAVSVGTKIFVYGGDCGDRYEGDIDMFDMDTLTWSRLVVQGSSPGVRAGHAAVNIGLKIYVIGGVGDKQYYNDVWVFDINACSWTQLEICGQQPQGRFSHTAIVAETDIALFGGCGEDEHPVNELLILQLGAEHPNGRYNISLCKIFGKHFNQERRRLSREMRNYSRTALIDINENILRKEDLEHELESKQSLKINSDVLQSKRKRTSNSKIWETESEPEEHSLSLSQQSSPSHSDQEQTPIKRATSSQVFPSFKQQNQISSNAQSNNVSITQKKPISFLRRSPHDFRFLTEHPNKTISEQNSRIVHMGSCKAQSQASEQKSSEAGPLQHMVGAEVQGKIDGAFDSGYLMTAIVNGKIFRGVLFPPGPGATMTQNPSPLTSQRSNVAQSCPPANHTTPTLVRQPNTHYVADSGVANITQTSPVSKAGASRDKEPEMKGDLHGMFLTLGGPGGGHCGS